MSENERFFNKMWLHYRYTTNYVRKMAFKGSRAKKFIKRLRIPEVIKRFNLICADRCVKLAQLL